MRVDNSGVSEVLSTRIDDSAAPTSYFGFAVVASSESAPVWRIKRLTVTASITKIEFADGDTKFDNIWANRYSLSYS